MRDMLQNKTQVETVNFDLNCKSHHQTECPLNLRLVLKRILHSQDVFFWNLLFTLLFQTSCKKVMVFLPLSKVLSF